MATRSIILTGSAQLCVRCFGSANGCVRGKIWYWKC